MKLISHNRSNLLFELTHPYEAIVIQELKDYFDSMYFAN